MKGILLELLEMTKGVFGGIGRGAVKLARTVANREMWSGFGRGLAKLASKEFWGAAGHGLKALPGGTLKVFEGLLVVVKNVVAATQWIRVLQIGACSMVTVMMIFGGAAMLFKEEGTLTVGIQPRPQKGEAAISLSETPDFDRPVTSLGADGIDNMTNISVDWLPDDLDTVDGSHNGDHYIAYTFYLKNTGDLTCNVTETFEIESAVKGADSAIRIRLYKNGEMITYAKLGADGEPEEGTVPFESDTVAFSAVNEDFKEKDIIKYTLVIWLEGDDPECLDNIKGGNVRMSMTFSAEPVPVGG